MTLGHCDPQGNPIKKGQRVQLKVASGRVVEGKVQFVTIRQTTIKAKGGILYTGLNSDVTIKGCSLIK